MKDLRKIAKLSILIAIIIQLISFVFSGFDISEIVVIKGWVITLGYSFVLTLVNSLYFNFLNNQLSWEKEGLKKMIFGVLGAVIVTMSGLFLCRILHLVVIENKVDLQDFLDTEKTGNYLITLLFAIIISLFFHAIGFYKALQEKKVEEQKIIAGTASAKYDALKNQLDPHFLFNSLNVLTSLIGENPKMAEKFTTSLSKVYRYVLEQKNKNLVSVDEELKFARIYVSLLQMRFEDSIVLDIPESAGSPDAKVVPLSLQILLENTVKHNIVMSDKPLYIKVYEADGYLMVENNLQPKEVLKESTGVGLNNVKQRYKLLTKREFMAYKTKDNFVAKLPILTKKITVVTEKKDATMDLQSIKYQNAQERLKELKGFYSNLTAYCIVIPTLAVVNLLTNPNYLWFLFSMIGWGIGVAIHAFTVFGYNFMLGKNWEQRKIKEFMKDE